VVWVGSIDTLFISVNVGWWWFYSCFRDVLKGDSKSVGFIGSSELDCIILVVCSLVELFSILPLIIQGYFAADIMVEKDGLAFWFHEELNAPRRHLNDFNIVSPKDFP